MSRRKPSLFSRFRRPSAERTRRAVPLGVHQLEDRSVPASVMLGFAGASDNSFAPPDTMGAVGPNHYVQLINGHYGVYDKDTGTLLTPPGMPNTQFWINAGVSPAAVASGTGDSRILFDTLSNRWFAVEFTLDSSDNLILVGRSDTSDPMGSWEAASFVGAPGGFADFPTLGIDANGVYIGTLNFGGASGSTVTSIPKADLLLPTPTVANRSTLNSPTLAVGQNVQPVTNFNPSPSHATLISSRNNTPNNLFLTQVTGTGGPGAVFGPTQTISVQPDSLPGLTRQPDGTREIDGSDSRISGMAYQVGDLIFTARSLSVNSAGVAAPEGANTHNGVRVTVIRDSTQTVVTEATYFSNTYDYTYPSIAVNQFGNILIGFSRSGGFGSVDGNIGAYAIEGKIDLSNPAAGITFTGSDIQLKAGQVSNYHLFGVPGERWGDYSATQVDPSDPFVFWTTQEYAISANRWGTWVSSVSLAAHVTNVTSPVANGTYGQGAVIPIRVAFSEPVTVTGTPTLALNSGGTATYASGSGTGVLTFNYPVGPGDDTPDLDYTSIASLSLNGGTIQDTANGLNAVLTLSAPNAPGSLGANKNIAIDTTIPTLFVVSAVPGGGLPTVSSPLGDIDVTYSEPVFGFTVGNSDLVLSQGTVTGFTILSPTTVRYHASGLVEGPLDVFIPSGAVAASGPLFVQPYSTTLTVELVVAPFPTPLIPTGPLGWLSYTGEFSSVINPDTDTDSLTLPVDGGSFLTVVVDQVTTLQPLLELLDPSQNVVASSSSPAPGTEARVSSFFVPADGTYTIRVGSAVGSTTSGGYRVAVYLNTAFDADQTGGSNDTIGTAQPLNGSTVPLPGGGGLVTVMGTTDLVPGGRPVEEEPNNSIPSADDARDNFIPAGVNNIYQLSVTGEITTDADQDWFNLGVLHSGDVITITMSGRGVGGFTLSDTWAELHGASVGLVQFDNNNGPGSDSLIYKFTIATTDTYFLRAEPFSVGQKGTYRLGVYLEHGGLAPTTGGNFFSELEPPQGGANDTLASAQDASSSWRQVRYQSETAGTITAGDTDVFRYSFTAGDIVSFRVPGSPNFVPQVNLRNSFQVILAEETAASVDLSGLALTESPVYSFRIATTGDYYLTVRAGVGSTGSYTAFVDLATDTPLTIPASGDHYAVTLQSGQLLSVGLERLTGTSAGISLLDASGAVIAASTTGSANFDLGISYVNTAATAQTYYLRVLGASQGDYELAAAIGGVLDREVNDAPAGGQPLNLTNATQVVGAITPGNSDWYTIEVPLGNTLVYQFQTFTPGDGAGQPVNTFDPLLEFTRPNGTLVVSNDNDPNGDGRNAFLSAHLSTPGTYRLRVRGANATTSGEYFLTLTTAVNVPPQNVSAGGPYSVAEGNAVTLSASATDANGDTLTYSWDLNNDGSFGDASGPSPTVNWLLLSALGLDDGTADFPVRVRVSDGFSPPIISTAATLTVVNAPPTATFTGGSTNEGGSATVNFSDPTDPSTPDVAAGFRYSYALTPAGLAGTYAAATDQTSASFSFDDNATYTVYGRVFDVDDDFTEYTTTVTVNNVAPTGILVPGPTVTVGTPSSATWTNQFDISAADRAAPFRYSFDFNNDGDFTDPGDIQNSLNPTGQFAYAQPGTYLIHGRIIDKDGGFADARVSVVVEGLPPAGTIVNSGPVGEGGAATVSVVNVTHPSPIDTAAGFHYSFDFNNDGTWDVGNGTYAGSSDTPTASVPAGLLADGAVNRVIRARVTTVSGGVLDLTTTLAVLNVAPTATVTGPGTRLSVGSPATFTFSNPFDPAVADAVAGFRYSFDFNNDGDFTDPGEVSLSTSPTATGAFATNGALAFHGRITDKDGGFTDYLIPVTVFATAKQWYAVGSDLGSAPVARLYDPTGRVRFEGAVFGPEVTGGVRVAVADVTGDGTPDLIAGSGPGAVAQIVVIDGATGQAVRHAQPFGPFTGGTFVAAGDADGDGKAEIAVSPDEGGGARVVVYRGQGFVSVLSFLGIDDTGFRGGARVAMGDTTGDGRADLFVSAGFQGGPRVVGYDGTTLFSSSPRKLFNDFFAFDPGLRNGVYLAVGDLDGDGKAELIAGAGPGGGPQVIAYSGAALLTGRYVPVANLFAGDLNSRGGVRVAVADVDGDFRSDILTGPGFGSGPRVNIYLAPTIPAIGQPVGGTSFDPFSTLTSGVFVG